MSVGDYGMSDSIKPHPAPVPTDARTHKTLLEVVTSFLENRESRQLADDGVPGGEPFREDVSLRKP
jgi:hypothetical protein